MRLLMQGHPVGYDACERVPSGIYESEMADMYVYGVRVDEGQERGDVRDGLLGNADEGRIQYMATEGISGQNDKSHRRTTKRSGT